MSTTRTARRSGSGSWCGAGEIVGVAGAAGNGQPALAEIGAVYEVRDVDLEAEGQRDAGYAAVNPQRKLPTIFFRIATS